VPGGGAELVQHAGVPVRDPHRATAHAIDPRVSLVVDSCDLVTGQVLAVTARGKAVVHALDPQRAIRKLTKYLGHATELWPSRFQDALTDSTTRLVSLQPTHDLVLRDMSYDPPVK
jgi:hypothetical protein